jgi:hypothetical protein
MTTKINVDFNDIETGGRMTALIDHADGPVEVGTTVILRDADENVVQGRVISIIGRLATIDVDWTRWNNVNTLLDALDEAIQRAQRGAASFEQLVGLRPTGFDPEHPPEKHVDIAA